MSLSPGDKLGVYEILSRIGAGGMGEVYRARDQRLERDVAAKVLAPEYGNASRFEQEAKALAALNHPNILAIYEFGEQMGAPYIISELVHGETLRTSLGKLSLNQILDIAAQICDGLGAAHALGIAHRDLKPDNVMLTREGVVKILDFGLARQQRTPGPDEATLTAGGMILGTAGYMAPEQAAGERSGASADIFSMGVLLYEMLTGTQPFRRPTSVESLAATIREDAPPLPECVAPGLRQIVSRCLEKTPAKRFQSAADLAFALRSLSLSTVTATSAQRIRSARNWKRAALIACFALTAGLAAGFGIRHALSDTESLPMSGLHMRAFSSAPETEVQPAFSPDGKFVAYFRESPGGRRLIVRPLNGPPSEPLVDGRINHIQWAPDGNRIYYQDRTSVMSISASGGEPQLVLKLRANEGFELSPDGRHLLLARTDAPKKWKIADSSPPGAEPKSILEMESDGPVSVERFSPDGKFFLVRSSSPRFESHKYSLIAFPKGSPRVVHEGSGTSSVLFNLHWFPDGRHIVFSKLLTEYTEIRLAEIANIQSSYLVLRSFDPIISMSLSPDGKRLVYSVGPVNWDLVEYDLETKKSTRSGELRVFESPINYSADGTQLLWRSSVGRYSTLKLRSAQTDRVVLEDRSRGTGSDAISGARISPDGKRVAYLKEGHLWVFAGAGKPARLSTVEGASYGLCWSSDGKHLGYFRVETGRRMYLERIPSSGGEPKRLAEAGTLVFNGSCAWSEDGKWIAITGDQLRFINANSGEVHVVKDYIARTGLFGRDGRFHAWRKEGLALLEVPSGRELGFDPIPLEGPSQLFFTIHPSGRRVAYSTGTLAYDLWMMDMPQPATGLERLWRKWTLPPEPTEDR